ncbi:hypothetical protein [Natronococcus pandeyae]|nr:hypothetical protein [Natronococcus pandeyae]
MRTSTILIVVGFLLIVIPIPVLPPLVGTVIGVFLVLGGVLLRVFGL